MRTRNFIAACPAPSALRPPTTSPPFDLHMILNYNGRNRDDRVEESAAARESVSLSLAPARPSPVGLIKYLLTDGLSRLTLDIVFHMRIWHTLRLTG